jgi:hypothetical protein
LDIRTPHVPNNAQNGNQGSNLAYFPEKRIFMTGLNGAFFCIFSRISVDWAYYWEYLVLTPGKPACLNLFGCRIPE